MSIGIAGLVLILANVIVSYIGLTNKQFFDDYKFEVDRILIDKDYKRLVTSGFLHVNGQHLLFNMISLLFFSGIVEAQVGIPGFLVIYFAALLGGDLLALFVHRHHGDYSAVGASGAVSGIVFASIAMYPGMAVSLFMLPVGIPAWIYGIIYVLYSIYGVKSKKDNIGHEAHLGGLLTGMLVAILLKPVILLENYLTILLIMAPVLAFIYLIITRPQILLIDNYYFKKHKPNYTIEHKYNEQKVNRQKEIDAILDKISRQGINSLTKKEKEKLDEYSGRPR